MGPAAVPALIDSLRDPELVVYAVAALGSIGEPAVSTLMDLLNDQDEEVANYAGLSLARIGEPAIAPLFNLFNEDKTMVALISSIFANMGGVALPRLLDEFKTLETTGQQGSERGISLMSMILDISMNDAPQMHHLFSLKDPEMQRMLTGILVSKGTTVIDPFIKCSFELDKTNTTPGSQDICKYERTSHCMGTPGNGTTTRSGPQKDTPHSPSRGFYGPLICPYHLQSASGLRP